MKTLAKHLDDLDLSHDEFADELGVKPERVRRYCLPIGHSEYRIPRFEMMRVIFTATRGVVEPNDYYDLPELPNTGGAA